MTTRDPEGKADISHSLPPGSLDDPSHEDPGKSAESGAAPTAAHAPVKKPRAKKKQKLTYVPDLRNPQLISELVPYLAEGLRTGRIVPDQTRFSDFGPAEARWASQVVLPKALVPFVESRHFEDLSRALEDEPLLYWTRVVRDQIHHLAALRFRWLGEPPPEVADASAALTLLLDAHVRKLLPSMQLTPRKISPKRGRPKKAFENRYPSGDPDTHAIPPEEVYEHWSALRKALETDLKPEMGNGIFVRTNDQPRELRVSELAAVIANVLERETPWWHCELSANYDSVPENVSPGAELLFASWDVVRINARPIAEHVFDAWNRRGDDRLRAGRIEYLASAILAAFLEEDPATVQERMDSHRRSLPVIG